MGTTGNGAGYMEMRDGPNNTQIKLTASGNSYINTGSLGIGTTTPTAQLELYRDGSDANVKITSRDVNGTGRKATLDLGSNVFNVNENRTYAYRLLVDGGTGTNDYTFQIKGLERNSNAEAERTLFALDANGRLGLGTNTPGSFANTNVASWPSYSSSDQVITNYSASSNAILELASGNTSDAKLGGIYFTNTNNQSDAHRQVAALLSESDTD